jgi:hypothetical protein
LADYLKKPHYRLTGSGEDPFVGDEGTSAKVLAIDENSHLPVGFN